MVESNVNFCVPRMYVSLYSMGMYFRCSPPTFPCLTVVGRENGRGQGSCIVILQFIKAVYKNQPALFSILFNLQFTVEFYS